MRDLSGARTETDGSPGAGLLIALFLLAIHTPSLFFGGNRFGLILPSAVIILVLLAWRAPGIVMPRYASWLWLGVMAWGGAQIIFGLTKDSGEAARILARYALYAAIFLIAADRARRPVLGRVLVKATAAWIALVCVYGLITWSAGENPVLGELEAYAAPLEATFINRNAFALYAVFGLLASLSALAGHRRGIGGVAASGWIWVAAALICGVSLILTGSRGGFGAGIVGLILFAVALGGGKAPAIGAAMVIIAAGAMGGAYLRDAPALADPRFAIHAQVLAETAKAPLTGHGLGGFQDAFRAPLGAEWRWGDWDHAHQQYLETAYELGWPAAIALFAAVALAAPRPVRGDPVAALGLAALGAAAAHALVDFSLTIPSIAMTLALLLGLGSGRQRRTS